MSATVKVRGGASGPVLTGTPGNALIIGPDGQSVTSTPIGPGAGVVSWNGRTNIVVPVANDYKASQVQNDSAVAGAEVSDALNTLQTAAAAKLVSFNGRTTPAAVPALNDYKASQVQNDSAVAGAEVSDALNTLNTAAAAKLVSFNGRTTPAAVPTLNDYAASQVANDSSVPGAEVSDALNNCITNASLVASVANWYVDSVGGSDSNNGRAPGTPFKTLEHLSQVLCPGGQPIYLLQATNVFLAAGSYGTGTFNINWGPLITFYGAAFTIIGAISSTANITLATAVVQNAAARTRGELTTASGTFVNRTRIRQTSGTQTGSLAWSAGLVSSTDTFIGPWVNFANNSQAGPVAGNTVVVDTLLTTIKNLNMQNAGLGYWQCNDCNLQSVSAISIGPTTTGGGKAPYLLGCKFSAPLGFEVVQSFGGIDLYSCFIGTGVSLWGSDFETRGCTLNGNVFIKAGTNMSWGVQLLDAAALFIGTDNRGGPVLIKTADNIEQENGAGLTAYTFGAGCMMIFGGSQCWGAASGGTYAIGFSMPSGVWLGLTAPASVSFPSTINYQITGHNIAYAGIPLGYPRANCGVFLNNDPAAVAVTI